ncbi:hypothetical protein [Lapillicoccus sp.]|jgi:hypothetical protein|nr:hypothetical protein [Lapillicoccus sp.]
MGSSITGPAAIAPLMARVGSSSADGTAASMTRRLARALFGISYQGTT